MGTERSQVRVLPRLLARRVAQLAEQTVAREFPGESLDKLYRRRAFSALL